MKYIFISILFFLTLSCSINKVSNTHGYRFIESKITKISINKSNKNDVKKIIGPPSTKSNFDDIWFYIERKKTNQSIYKLGKKKISKNNVLVVEFNNMGIVSNLKLLDLNSMKDIEIVEKITVKKFENKNRMYDILSTVREKLNTQNRKK